MNKKEIVMHRLLLALLLSLLLALPVSAAGHVDTEAKCSVDISFMPNAAAANVHFSLYKLADISQTSAPIRRDSYADFAGLTTLLTSENPDDYRMLCTGLGGYIASHELSSDYEAVTNASGTALFTAVEPGFYYVSGESYVTGDKSYIPEPFVLQLPVRTDRDLWDYSPHVSVKWNEKNELVTLELIKSWSDSAANLHEKDAVKVLLYADGELFGTFTLSAENNWRMTLKDMDGSRLYSVVESPIPEGYSVKVTQSGNRFLIQNSKKETDPPGPIPDTGHERWPAVVCIVLALGVLWINFFFGRNRVRNDLIAMTLSFAFALGGACFALKYEREETAAEKSSEIILEEIQTISEEPKEETTEIEVISSQFPTFPQNYQQSVYIEAPLMAMPSEYVESEDIRIIGTLEIPALEKSFPIGSEWTYENLKKCPCCYYGSVYQNNLVIAGHSYGTVFGPLWALGLGSECSFTDMDGNLFRYTLTEKEEIDPQDPEAMISGDWDLTLFTCAKGGGKQPRVALRFKLAE